MSTLKLKFVRGLAALAIAGGAAVGTAVPAHASAKDAADGVETFERDVYVIVGSTLRNPESTTDPDAPLFNVAGVNLGITWGQWQNVSVTSLMAVHGPHTDGTLTFAGLVPGGVYSLFYGTISPDSENPLCPGVERTLPLTSKHAGQLPDEASFVAAADGTATFTSRIEDNPFAAVQVFVALVFHSDGQTYGSLPNHGEFNTQGSNCRSSFGEDAMRQLLILQQW